MTKGEMKKNSDRRWPDIFVGVGDETGRYRRALYAKAKVRERVGVGGVYRDLVWWDPETKRLKSVYLGSVARGKLAEAKTDTRGKNTIRRKAVARAQLRPRPGRGHRARKEETKE